MYCYLCGQTYAGLIQYHCDDCKRVKRIINLYGVQEVVDILETVCLRKKDKRDMKATCLKSNIEDVKKHVDNVKKIAKSVSFSLPTK